MELRPVPPMLGFCCALVSSLADGNDNGYDTAVIFFFAGLRRPRGHNEMPDSRAAAHLEAAGTQARVPIHGHPGRLPWPGLPCPLRGLRRLRRADVAARAHLLIVGDII